MALIRVESETSFRQARPNTCHCDKGEVLECLNALHTIVDIVTGVSYHTPKGTSYLLAGCAGYTVR